MKKVCFIASCDIFPVSAGHHRAMYEICKYLHGLKDVRVKILVLSREKLRCPARYREIADEVVVIDIPRKWGLLDWLNKVTIRVGLDMMRNFWWSVGMRNQVVNECEGADTIVQNYVNWFALLPKKIRKAKTILVTHDLFFYRRASFKGQKTWLERMLVKANRKFEVRLLSSFKKVCVFGDYEVNLLHDAGLPPERVLKLGLPLTVEGNIDVNRRTEFDFITIGSGIYQNVEGARVFLTRVVPLLEGRMVSIAVAGGLSSCDIWDSPIVPKNLRVVRLGYVDDLRVACARALIGVGTVPVGSGIKVKNVEMIMNGLPMLLTDSGQEGIPVSSDGSINIDRVSKDELKTRLLAWLDCPGCAKHDGYDQGIKLRKEFSPCNTLRGLGDVICGYDA